MTEQEANILHQAMEKFKNQELAETEIRAASKTVDYNTTEFPLEYFIDKICKEEINKNLCWDKSQQSYFIESLLLGLPVLNIVINDNDDELKRAVEKELGYTKKISSFLRRS